METRFILFREEPRWLEQAAAWFHQKWGVPQEAYRESMLACLAEKSPVPQWYCIFRPSESKETVGVSPPSREKQVQVHGRESTGVLFWKEMAKERFAKRSSACHLFRLESFSFAHGVIPIDEDLVGTVLNPVQHSIC